MKRGFTLVEVMAVMAILLIGGSLTFGVFNSSSKLLNKGKELVDIQDSFRNVALDMEKEINDDAVIGYKFENIEIYTVDNYEKVDPVLLIDKGENSVLYFKGKKSNTDLDIFEKIIFDKNSISNNNIYVKESKTIINEIDGDVALSGLVNNLIEVKFNFDSAKGGNNRTYSTTINLDKNESDEVIDILDSAINSGTDQTTPNPEPETPTTPEAPIEPEIPSEPTLPSEIGSIAQTFSEAATFIVLDQNPYNLRKELISIQPINGNNSGINLTNVNYYIQAISTDVMKQYINTSTTINRNSFDESKDITKAPALKSTYIANGYTISGNENFKNIVPKNGRVILENNKQVVGCAAQVGNECVILVNGDLNIRALSTDKQFVLGATPNGNGQKILIYATGEVNIDIGNTECELIINNCTLISANKINIRANRIRLVNQSGSRTDKLAEFLKENLNVSQ